MEKESGMKPEKIKIIYPDELRDLMSRLREKDYVLLDVRLAREYEHEHIPGARLIPLHEFEGRLGEIEPGKKLIFYCSSGKRSMAAATLARDSGLFSNEMFNLEGGINAYAGKILEDYPRTDLFEQAKDIQSVLERAIALEKGAYRFYLGMLERIEDENIKKQVKRLADLEVAHARVLYQQGKEMFDRDFDSVFKEADQSKVEGGLNIDAWFQRADAADQEDACTFFLELALEMEYMAYDMYRNLAEEDFPGETIDCFFRLSEQEKSHMRVIANLFRDCSSVINT